MVRLLVRLSVGREKMRETGGKAGKLVEKVTFYYNIVLRICKFILSGKLHRRFSRLLISCIRSLPYDSERIGSERTIYYIRKTNYKIRNAYDTREYDLTARDLLYIVYIC